MSLLRACEADQDTIMEEEKEEEVRWSWSELPAVPLRLIFQYLDLTELLSVGGMCNQWHEVAREASLWKELKIDDKEYFPQRRAALTQLLDMAPCLAWLNVELISTRKEAWVNRLRGHLLKINCEVRRLDNLNCQVASAWVPRVMAHFGPHLEWLRLVAADRAALLALGGMPRLRHLCVDLHPSVATLISGLDFPERWAAPPVHHLDLNGATEATLRSVLYAFRDSLRSLTLTWKEEGMRVRLGCAPDGEVFWPQLLPLLQECALPRLRHLVVHFQHRDQANNYRDAECLAGMRAARRAFNGRVYVRCLNCPPEHNHPNSIRPEARHLAPGSQRRMLWHGEGHGHGHGHHHHHHHHPMHHPHHHHYQYNHAVVQGGVIHILQHHPHPQGEPLPQAQPLPQGQAYPLAQHPLYVPPHPLEQPNLNPLVLVPPSPDLEAQPEPIPAGQHNSPNLLADPGPPHQHY